MRRGSWLLAPLFAAGLSAVAACSVNRVVLVEGGDGGSVQTDQPGTDPAPTSGADDPMDAGALPKSDAGTTPPSPSSTASYVVTPIAASCTPQTLFGNKIIQTDPSYPALTAGLMTGYGPTFPITVLGKPMVSMFAGQDGWLEFLPNPSYGPNAYGVFFGVFDDDYHLYGGGGLSRVYASLVASDELVITWDHMNVGATDHYGPGSDYGFTMQAHVFSNGVLEAHYCSGFGPSARDTGSTARIGVWDHSAPNHVVLAGAHQANTVANGQGYRFTPTP